MNDSERNRMIEKIKRLVALSQSPNEHEAALAADKAQELLALYNLSMSDLDTESKDEEFMTDEDLETDSLPWRRHLATMVAKMYFCSYFYTFVKRPSLTRSCGYVRYDKHSFVGARHNIEVAKMMFKYLIDTIDRLADEGSSKVTPGERSPYRTSFRHACALRLCTRIHKRIEAAKAGTAKTETGTNLPALASLYDRTSKALEEYNQKKHPALKSSKTKVTMTHSRGVIDGQAAGDKIGLDQQVSGKGSAHLLR